MFKVGDKVCCVKGYPNITKGKTYTIEPFAAVGPLYTEEADPYYGKAVTITNDKGYQVSVYSFRFKLDEPMKTDQELADEYRRLIPQAWAFGDELKLRGYKINIANRNTIIISKTKTEVIEL